MMFWLITLTAEQVYWIKLGIIALIDVAAIWWVWEQVKKADAQNAASEKHSRELREEIETLIRPSVPPILNQSERWLINAREAESADDFWDGAA